MSRNMGTNILLVDDEVELLEVTKEAIGDYFHEVFTATGVTDAVRILETQRINVVVCDFKMPNADGLDLRNIMSQKFPDVQFMMMTGYADDPKILNAKKQGEIFNVIEKPTQIEKLVEIIAPRKKD